MDLNAVDAATFRLNPKLDVELLARAYRGRPARLHIPNFLSSFDADRLYQHLHTEISWRTLLVANGRQLGTSAESSIQPGSAEDAELMDFAYQGARTGFASIFDANGPVTEAAHDDIDLGSDVTLLPGFGAFLNSERFLSLVRQLTALPELARVDVQATRFRPGHFSTFHRATESADPSGKCRVGYCLSLTPEWRPEWGGLLEFRGPDGAHIEAIQPCFNTFELFSFPQGHWVSLVAPFAAGPRYALCGSMYVA